MSSTTISDKTTVNTKGNDDDIFYDNLKQYSFARKNNFLSVNLASDLLKEAMKLENSGKLKYGGMNKGNYLHQVKPNQRGDKMLWVTSLSDKEVSNCFKMYLREMKTLRKRLNEQIPNLCLDGKISIQLAYYPGGGSRYVRHIDAFAPNKGKQLPVQQAQTRKITAITYLNRDWNEQENGGELRAYINQGLTVTTNSNIIFETNDDSEHYVDTSPIFNRMIVFYSDKVEHEVLPCNSSRYALTSWFYTKNENYYRNDALVIGKRFPKVSVTNVNKNDEDLIKTSGFMMIRPGDLNNEKLQLKYEIPRLPPTITNNENQKKQTIFVSIPSYRDPECQYTIQNIFETATYPERVFIGVCMQYDRITDTNCFILPPKRPNQVRMIHMDHRDAKGPSYARYMIEKLYKKEDYILQVDSHMRLRPNWDMFLIDHLHKCPSSKPIITAYPLGYTLPNNIPVNESTNGTLLCASHFDEDGILRIKGKRFHAKDDNKGKSENELVPSLFWASGFSFSRGYVYNEVPYDPLPYLFFGEESIMCARLWTSGYDFFATKEAVAYHLWSRANRPVFQQHLNKEKEQIKRRSKEAVIALLNINSVNDYSEYKYNLGNNRTLKEFQDHIGVSFDLLTIAAFAKNGGQTKSIFNIENNATVAEDGKSTIKDGKNLDSLISNVILLMKKRGDV
jgi:[Skp1-protein]-hydroxyproline N-acetylglucosaminyltransferase